MSAEAHPGYGPWQSPELPPDYWLRNPKIGPIPGEGYERPRQCLIEDDDAISFSKARAILERKWSATTTEIRLWLALDHPGLHGFNGAREIKELVDIGGIMSGVEFSFWRCRPGLPGSTRPCVERAGFCLFGMPDAPDSEVLSLFKFSKSEAEAFDPAKNEYDPTAPIEYLVDEVGQLGRNWFNPSGRLLTYKQAVAFLSRYSLAPEDSAAVIKREYERSDLVGLAPRGHVVQNSFVVDNPPPVDETLYFFEGQVIGLAKDEFGANVTRWDEASRPEVGKVEFVERGTDLLDIPREVVASLPNAAAPGRKPDPRMQAAYRDAKGGGDKTPAAREAIEKHYPTENAERKRQLTVSLRGYLQPSKTPKWAQ